MSSSQLTEEQLQRIKANRLAAQAKLRAKKKERFLSNLHEPSWGNVLLDELSKPYWDDLIQFLTEERNNEQVIFPPENQIFAAFNHCSFDDLKAVILGQDPYVLPGQADGMCFSVQKGVKVPPSLCNIYKELQSDDDLAVPFVEPPHGYLMSWAQQGVLLLNAILTVRKGQPNSHQAQGWETFTNAVIQTISERKENVVFLLWGAKAQEKSAMVDKRKHLVLTASHPSPHSADRGFFGCKHFSQTNKFLERCGLGPIDWSINVGGSDDPSGDSDQFSNPTSLVDNNSISAGDGDGQKKKRSFDSMNEGSKEQGGCFTCGLQGHYASQCPKRPRTAFNGAVPNCPGHNKPCAVLTSGKEISLGRMYFVCAEQPRCKFFQWADEEAKEKNAKPAASVASSSSSSVSGGGGGGTQEKGNVCFKCKQPGHWSRDCPAPSDSSSSVNTCFKCKQPGHWAKDCTAAPMAGSGSPMKNIPNRNMGGGAPSNCFNCGQAGHWSRDCPAPRKAYSSGGSGGGRGF